MFGDTEMNGRARAARRPFDARSGLSRRLLDHVIGAREQCFGNLQVQAFAVLRLTINSNFGGRSIGMSAGLVVCTENLIRVDEMTESPKLKE